MVPLAAGDPDEVRGINSRGELAEAAGILRKRKLAALMDSGVTSSTRTARYVETECRVGPDSVLEPGILLTGKTPHRPGRPGAGGMHRP